MPGTFLTAEWRKLIMANYAIDPQILTPYIPVGTTLDLYDGNAYVSLVGFLFQDTRLLSLPIPFHRTFEEVNLRFYVQHTTASGERRRGVVFISELVPRRAIGLIANTIYGENYRTLPMRHSWEESTTERSIAYQWKYRGRWNTLIVKAALKPEPIAANSTEEFFTEHYWGYTHRGAWTSEYAVLHPRWMTYLVMDHSINVDFSALYGSAFAFLSDQPANSILLAEGSEVEVKSGKRLAATS